MSKNSNSIALVLCLVTFGGALLMSCGRPSIDSQGIENAHGLKLVPSARSFQQLSKGSFIDDGVLSMFEIDSQELDEFIAQLEIQSRHVPTITGPGNPCVNGWNVWPTNAETFTPGNRELSKLRRTWVGDAVPIEMLSCGSPLGDWLHVEIWSVEGSALIKMYTDWN